MKFPLTQVHVIAFTLLLTVLVYWDCRKHHIAHGNLWIVATVFFPPVVLAYGILRFVTSHKIELTKRQKLEMVKRQEFAQRSKQIRAERRALEKAATLRRAGKSEALLAGEQQAEAARQEEERKKLRENLEYHAKRRAEKLKISNKDN